MSFKKTPTGERRHRVTIQARNDTNAKGSTTIGYTSGDDWWARIMPARSDEMIIAEREAGKTYYRVNIEYYSALTTKHRLQIKGMSRFLAIEGIKDLHELHREQELVCSEAI